MQRETKPLGEEETMKHLKSVSQCPAYAVTLPAPVCNVKAGLRDFMQANFNMDCPCYADKCGDNEVN